MQQKVRVNAGHRVAFGSWLAVIGRSLGAKGLAVAVSGGGPPHNSSRDVHSPRTCGWACKGCLLDSRGAGDCDTQEGTEFAGEALSSDTQCGALALQYAASCLKSGREA